MSVTDVITLQGEAAEVVLAEAQAVRAMVADEERRHRLSELVAAAQDGEVPQGDADALSELIELGLQTGRIRAVYGPAGEQAAQDRDCEADSETAAKRAAEPTPGDKYSECVVPLPRKRSIG